MKKYLIYKGEELLDESHIYVKSQSRKGKCSQCGHESSGYHATYKRTLQTLPLHEKTTYVHVIAYKFHCLNPELAKSYSLKDLILPAHHK